MRKITLKKIRQHFLDFIYLTTGITLVFKGFSCYNYLKLRSDLKAIKKQAALSNVSFPISTLRPCYTDSNESAGDIPIHYFYQDLYIAQRIHLNNPQRHTDIGSRLDGFIAHVASFRKIEVFDIRPLSVEIPNVKFVQADLMNISNFKQGSIESMSCLHVLEHFGLGRYGDSINYNGYLIGFENITKLLKKGGRLYLSVPLGKQRIEFHAHRVFSLQYLLSIIEPYYSIVQFSYIDDHNKLYANISITHNDIETNCGCHYGCAIFELIKT